MAVSLVRRRRGCLYSSLWVHFLYRFSTLMPLWKGLYSTLKETPIVQV